MLVQVEQTTWLKRPVSGFSPIQIVREKGEEKRERVFVFGMREGDTAVQG